MSNRVLKITALSIALSSLLIAGGYKIPENSLNAVALSAANVANNHSADAAYYNPANMVFMADENSVEADLMYIGLDATHYKSTAGAEIDAKTESFYVPSIHYVSSKISMIRVGLSIVSPGGLTKRWSDSPAKDKAEEFALQVVETNPTIALELADNLSFGVGFRILHTSGVVKSSAVISRDLKGESIDAGYNFALAYKPLKDLSLALTYRSNVDLSVEGNAKLALSGTKVYDGGASVSVPSPATWNVAAAYTLPSQTTVEFVYERVMWSAYKTLDFNYVSPIPAALVPYFDNPIEKNWKDTNVYRLGLTQKLDALTLMAGAVYDETPVPDATLSFELPDSNSLALSLGGRYQIDSSFDVGLAALYSMKDSRSVTNADLSGEFSNSNILLVSAGVGYKF
jgi:long-chain fatty acid transport protein